MSHPILIAALVEDRRRRCPCGAVSHHPDGLCREGRATVVRRRKTTRTDRRSTLNWTRAGRARARIFSRVGSLLQIIGKGAES